MQLNSLLRKGGCLSDRVAQAGGDLLIEEVQVREDRADPHRVQVIEATSSACLRLVNARQQHQAGPGWQDRCIRRGVAVPAHRGGVVALEASSRRAKMPHAAEPNPAGHTGFQYTPVASVHHLLDAMSDKPIPQQRQKPSCGELPPHTDRGGTTPGTRTHAVTCSFCTSSPARTLNHRLPIEPPRT